MQKRLAEEVTRFVHGEDALAKALETTEKLFTQQHADADSLSVEDLQSLEGIVHMDFSKSLIKSGVDVVTFLTETKILPSKGEARKMIQNGGILINRRKVDNIQLTIDSSHLLHHKYVLVQKGKKNYYLVKAF